MMFYSILFLLLLACDFEIFVLGMKK